MNAFGIAVRSGFITPQVEDEPVLRATLGLPELGNAASRLWETQGGVRQPVTLKSGAEGAAEAESAGEQNDEN